MSSSPSDLFDPFREDTENRAEDEPKSKRSRTLQLGSKILVWPVLAIFIYELYKFIAYISSAFSIDLK